MSRPVHSQIWLLPGRSSIARLHKQLQCIAGLKAVNSHTEQSQFLDSFDWRLYRQGLALQALSRNSNLMTAALAGPAGGPGTKTIIYENAAFSLMALSSGVSELLGSHSAGGGERGVCAGHSRL